MTRFVKAAEVAEMLGVAVNTVYKWADERRLPYVDLGEGKKRCLRFRLEAIEKLLAAKETVIEDKRDHKPGRLKK